MLGEQIKSVRISSKLTQVEFAKILNVSKQSVSNWEHNNIMPSIDILKDIATKFGVSTDYLLELEKNLSVELDGLPIEFVIHINQVINDFKSLYNKEVIFYASKSGDL